MLHDAAAAAAPPLPPDRDEGGGRHVLRGSIMGNKVGATGTARRARRCTWVLLIPLPG